MRVLLIKTSSMGDIIHTLPALTDAGQAIANIRFDWAVEPSFQEIPRWHPLVDQVIPVALRQWRKGILSAETHQAWRAWRKQASKHPYDMVLDAQGLVKSAFLTFFTQGLRVGLDWQSARESLASLVYHHQCKVNFYQHAIMRMRQLFSQALQYPLPDTPPVYGLDHTLLSTETASEKYMVFLHGTTWASKQWPENYWLALAHLAEKAGYRVKIGGGNPEEVARAERIASQCRAVDLVPYLSIAAMAQLLVKAKAAVAVDTGFGHLAAALNIPTISLYGATNPAYTGALGTTAVNLSADFACAPCLQRDCHYQKNAVVKPACYATLTPERVWENVKANLKD